MYTLNEQHIDHILNDIKLRGVEMEDLQSNLLDHICCIIEQELEPDGDFYLFYQKVILRFFKKELREVEEETIFLLTYKHYYAMKKTMIISGTVSVAAFIAGSFFKFMHWPGAGVCLVLGITIFSLIFLPLLFLLKTRETQLTRDKIVLAIGTVVGALYCLSMLFKVMHWPGSRIMWLSTLSLAFFVLIPVHFFTGIRKAETKVNTIVSTILLIAATGIQFTLTALRPSTHTTAKLYTYIQSEGLLKKMQSKMNDTIAAHAEENKLTEDIQSICDQLRALVVKSETGVASLPEDFETKNIIFTEHNLSNNIDVFESDAALINQLKTKVLAYNDKKAGNIEYQIPVTHTVLDLDMENLANCSNLYFLNDIVQLQLTLANSKREEMMSMK